MSSSVREGRASDECRNEHHIHRTVDSSQTEAVCAANEPNRSNDVCNFCFEDIPARPEQWGYGILSNCNHKFCWGCLEKQSKSSAVLECPVCRTTSWFLARNTTWVDWRSGKEDCAWIPFGQSEPLLDVPFALRMMFPPNSGNSRDSVVEDKPIESISLLRGNHVDQRRFIDCRFHRFGMGHCLNGSDCYHRHRTLHERSRKVNVRLNKEFIFRHKLCAFCEAKYSPEVCPMSLQTFIWRHYVCTSRGFL